MTKPRTTSSPKILVTGAGGTVGSALRAELAFHTPAPRLAFHSPAKLEAARARGDDAVLVDFAAAESLRPALSGMDAVFLLAAGGRGQYEAETAVVREAKAAGVKRIVKLSVWMAASEAYSFAKLHRPIERAIEDSGLELTFLRPNGFMQNYVNFWADSIRGGRIAQPAADAKISYIDARDIAKVAAVALTEPGHHGKAYELSGPAALSYDEAARVLSNALGRTITYTAVSDEAAKRAMVSHGVPDFYADDLIDLNRFYRTGAGAAVTHAVREVTGQEPRGFEAFAREHVGAWG